jgi:poly-gamma-glutamate capsule biosynthesis protein CapA/YwtB (metallophosphatase superfamily)
LNKARRRKQNKKKSLLNTFLLLFFCVILTIATIKIISSTTSKSKEKQVISRDIPKTTENNTSNLSNAKKEAIAAPIIKDINTEVLMSAVGDCTIGTDSKFNYETSLPAMVVNQDKDFSYLFKNVSSIFSTDDVTIANLETTFTDSTDKENKQFTFKASSDYAKSLPLGSIEGVNISNNHIYDYKLKGFEDTKLALENVNVNYFGEGSKWVTTINDQSFGFLGYRGWSLDKVFLSKIKEDIAELKKTNSVVIINFHWGSENQYYPIAAQKELAYYAIDNGADIILGHHPHVIQGIERYKNRIIAYSLGNFCFGGNSNPKDKDTFIFQSNFKFTNNSLTSIGIRVIPCSISSVSYRNDYCPTVIKGDAKLNLLTKLNKISADAGFKISDDFFYININNN